MGVMGHDKSINAHLHLFECYLDYPGAPLAKLLTLLENWPGGDRFDRSWRRLDKVPCLGHQLEFSWLRSRALVTLGESPWNAQSETIFACASQGYDRYRGGFLEVPFRPWLAWQGDLVGSGGGTVSQSLGKSVSSQICQDVLGDSQVGQRPLARSSLPRVACALQSASCKGGPWKTPYHIGRCLLEGSDLLRSYEARQ
jgi:hypothetical protein